MDTRKSLIDSGVRNLREYGYPQADASNILTDGIYREFFRSMLEHNKGRSAEVDGAIDGLLAEIAEPQP